MLPLLKPCNFETLKRALLYGRSAAKLEKNLADGLGEGAVD